MNKFREPVTNQYLKERICDCEVFTYEPDFNWDQTFQHCVRPPTCAVCMKWMNRVHTCIHCRQQYYEFFWHPLMTAEASVDKFPWECWDCLETWARWVPCKGSRTIPPPAEVLIPDREPQVMVHTPEFDEAMAFLQKLTGKP